MAFYALTIFIGAFLLFQVQPLIGKYILPWFGGGPGVWTTCMLFFQVLLVGGYGYAHLSARRLRPRQQVILHLALAAAALATLPVTPADTWKPHDGEHPVSRILALLAISVGLPYFVLAATGPLFQHWFSRSHPGRSPYRLYALSNAGSLLALVSYPFYFEPHFSRKVQAALWTIGMAAYAIGGAVCGIKLWRDAGSGTDALTEREESSETAEATTNAPCALANDPQSAPFFHRLLWVVLPACASVLLLATTNKLCLDVAVVPFLWVAPLALYLLSFVICFDSPRWYRRVLFTPLLAAALAGVVWALFDASGWRVWQQVAVYCAGLFVCCMVCHGELYRLRPGADHLTAYYLLISVGGALGGLFVGLVAPAIFVDYYELHWSLLLCAALFLVACLAGKGPAPEREARRGFWRWAAFAAGLAGLVVLAGFLWKQGRTDNSEIVHRSRNFYGVLTVFEHRKDDSTEHHFLLLHGRITHGLQFVDPDQARWPTSYYGETSGIGRAIRALPAGPRRLGLVGLGTGSLAVYGRAGDYLRIYEINPEVKRLATSRFTYLSNCAARVEVALGDARLSLEREPAQHFDLLALDAFSSDAIPVHLLTREAFEVYERHLKPDGILAIHISNHFLDLEPVVLNLARRFQYEVTAVDYDENDEEWWLYGSTWMLLTRQGALLKSPEICTGTRAVEKNWTRVPLWTDDFASLVPILK